MLLTSILNILGLYTIFSHNHQPCVIDVDNDLAWMILNGVIDIDRGVYFIEKSEVLTFT